MKILVTGSSGTIGTRLCETLLEQGHDVACLDWKPNKWQPSIEKLTTHLDLRDERALTAYGLPLTAPDVLIHLAANARVYDLVEEPLLARDNMVTTFNALEFARQRKIPRFIFASSRECYGNIAAEKYTEDLVRVSSCESPYAASKITGEALVEAYRRCYGLKTTILRFSNVYGMYDDSNRVIPLFLRNIHEGKPLKVFGKDKCLDFTYIDDTVAGIILAVTKPEAENETFNLAFGEGTTILHLAERVLELTKKSSPLEIGPSRTGEVTHYIADISKAKKVLGYDPKTSFEEGIKKTVEWYEKKL